MAARRPGGFPASRSASSRWRFRRDGSLLAAGGGTPARFGEIQLWDVASGKLRRSIVLTGDTVFGVSLSPDGTRVAAGCTDNTVRIVDTASGKELSKMGAHENWVLGTVFGADGKRIVSVGRDRSAKLTDAASGAFQENVNLLRGELTAIARHPSKEIVVIGGDERVPYIYMMDRPKNMKIADDTTLAPQTRPAGWRDRRAGMVARRPPHRGGGRRPGGERVRRRKPARWWRMQGA